MSLTLFAWKALGLASHTTYVNLHQITHTHSHMYFKRYSKVSRHSTRQKLRLRNQILNKITQKLDYTAQLLSTQKVMSPTPFSGVYLRSRFCHWLTALSMTQWSKWRHSSVVISNGRRHRSVSVDSLLQSAPDRVNSFIILFRPYPFINSEYFN